MPGIREAFAELTRLPVNNADPGARVTIAKARRGDRVAATRCPWPSASPLGAQHDRRHPHPRAGAAPPPVTTAADVAADPDPAAGARARSGKAPLVVGGQPRANLLPPEIILKRKQLKTRRALRAGVLLVAIGTAAGCVGDLRRRLGRAGAARGSRRSTQAALVARAGPATSEVRDVQSTIATIKAGQQVGASTEIDWRDYLTAAAGDPAGGRHAADTSRSSRARRWRRSRSRMRPLQGARVAALTFTATSPTLPSIPDWLRAHGDAARLRGRDARHRSSRTANGLHRRGADAHQRGGVLAALRPGARRRGRSGRRPRRQRTPTRQSKSLVAPVVDPIDERPTAPPTNPTTDEEGN